MGRLYLGLMFVLGMLVGAAIIVASWILAVAAYTHRFFTGRWPEWLVSRSGGAFKN